MENNTDNSYSKSSEFKKYSSNSNDYASRKTSDKQHDYYAQLASSRKSVQRPSSQRQAAAQQRPVVGQSQTGPQKPVVRSVQSGQSNSNSTKAEKDDKRQPKKRKKMSKTKKILISVICVLVALLVAGGGVGLHYLNLINYDDGTLQTAPTNPDGDDEEDILNGNLSADEADSLSDANESINANLSNNEIWYSDDVTNILLLGIDYGSAAYPYGRSDSMIVVSINNKTNKIKLVSLSRAAYSAIPGYKNTRLSHAHGYGGPALTIESIQNNYKIRIDGYASVNFSSFESIIDALGGVTVTLSSKEAKAISGKLGTSAAGTYNLNGKQALEYARTRKIDDDRTRTGRQRKVLEALAKKATNMSVTSMISTMDKVLPYVRTNISRTQLLSLLSKAPTYLGYEREQYVLPHKSSGLVLRDGFEVVIINWTDEVKYVHDLFYGDVEAKIM